MYKQFIIQNINTKEYFYGFYSNKNWTNDINEAKFFTQNDYNIEDVEHYIDINLEAGLYMIITIYNNHL